MSMGSARVSNGRPLGVLEYAVADGQHDVSPALAVLEELGLGDPAPVFRRAVGAALTHPSYLYEHPTHLPGVTKGLLDTLNALGSAYLGRLASIRAYQRRPSSTAGQMAKQVGQIFPQLPRWAVDQAWLVSSCRTGASFKGRPLPPNTVATMFRQLLGMLCLAGAEGVAEGLLEGLVSDTGNPQSIAEPRMELEVRLGGRDSISYEYHREGPDHAAVFTAVVTDCRGRQGTGEASSKKAATRNAALDFLTRHLPEVLQVRSDGPAPQVVLGEIPGTEAHRTAVRTVQDLFSLPVTARPLLGQALTHASWAYEHRHKLAPLHQRDNQALAYIGSQALLFEQYLVRAASAARTPPDVFVFDAVLNTTYDSALRLSGLAPALLLGVGEANQGPSVEVGATAFQAVIGAVFIAKRFPASLASEWPLEWFPLWRTITVEASPYDPASLLDRTISGMQLRIGFEFRQSGLDHQKRHHATAVLSSSALGISTRTREGTADLGKSAARFTASEVVLNVVDMLAERHPTRSLMAASDSDQSAGRFILTHQAAVLAGHRIPLPRWIEGRFFGLHWAGSPKALVGWATEADQLLSRVVDFEADIHHFEGIFRAARDAERADGQSRGIEVELAEVMEVLEQIQDPASLSRNHLDRLVRLCDIYRCLGTEDPAQSLDELVDDWGMLYRGRLDVAMGERVPAARLTGRERAILDALAALVVKPASKASVELLGQRPLRLRFTSGGELDQAAVARLCTLWASVTRTTTLVPTSSGVDVTVIGAHAPRDPGPITRAALASFQPLTDPYLASVADLLHDLKNQVVAARLATSAPAEGLTARLEQQLQASRHLDQAHALALRLRAATSSLGRTSSETLDLGPFLRSYAATVLSRLPGSIKLSVPPASGSVHVAMDQRALTAVLDNLVGNAIEAMPDGGAITLEWTADEYEAVVEVADTGPGLPEEVIAALASGDRIRSTKPGGNGLGLLGARALVTRAGGQLTALPAESGTTWLVTLPTATTNLETQ
ncbi:ATP-binding protein [Kitasatospora sp. NPDC059577]|uniref:ATP-binding protein n=1 Tax=Kitasatospora sp. NPDC059577 TaxID=3346873 RepID=UPI00368453FF